MDTAEVHQTTLNSFLSALSQPHPSLLYQVLPQTKASRPAHAAAQYMMGVGIDPRLQQPFYNGGEYPFPGQSSTGQYNENLQQYGFNQQQLSNGASGAAPAPRRGPNSNNVGNKQATSPTRLHNFRQQASSITADGQAPVQQSLPQRKSTSTPKQANGLVFKNSTSNFPSGGTSLANESEPFYVPLTTLQQSNINQSNSYFAPSSPPGRPAVPNPPPLSTEPNSGANPFDSTLALVPSPSWPGRMAHSPLQYRATTPPLRIRVPYFLSPR